MASSNGDGVRRRGETNLDFTQPDTLPGETVFVVRRGIAWLLIAKSHLIAEFVPDHRSALERAHALASERGWKVHDVTGAG